MDLDIEPAPFLERFVQRVLHRVQAGGQFNRLVCMAARKIQFPLVILHLHLNKFQTVRRGDDDHALFFVNLAGLEQFDQNRQRHAGVRAVEHAGAIAQRRGVGQFLLGGLLDDAVELFQRADRLLDADRVADLNGAGQCFLRLDRLERLEVLQVRAVKRIGPLGLRDDDARQFGNQAEVFHHHQALAERGHVAEVAAGNDHHVGHLPVELLDDFDAHRFLALDPQRIHRVRQVKRFVLGDFLDQPHAAVEVGVEIEHERAVGNRLDELRAGNFPARQQHDGLDAGRGAIGRQRRRGVAGGGADDGLDGRALGNHLLDLRHQHRHAEVFERAAVRVAAEFDPKFVHPDDLSEAFGPEKDWCRLRKVKRHRRR